MMWATKFWRGGPRTAPDIYARRNGAEPMPASIVLDQRFGNGIDNSGRSASRRTLKRIVSTSESWRMRGMRRQEKPDAPRRMRTARPIRRSVKSGCVNAGKRRRTFSEAAGSGTNMESLRRNGMHCSLARTKDAPCVRRTTLEGRRAGTRIIATTQDESAGSYVASATTLSECSKTTQSSCKKPRITCVDRRRQ